MPLSQPFFQPCLGLHSARSLAGGAACARPRRKRPRSFSGPCFGGAFGGGRGAQDAGGFDFGSIFGGAGSRQGFRRGPDLQVRVRIPFLDAVKGTQKTLNLPTRDVTGRQTSRTVTVDIPAGRLARGSCRPGVGAPCH